MKNVLPTSLRAGLRQHEGNEAFLAQGLVSRDLARQTQRYVDVAAHLRIAPLLACVTNDIAQISLGRIWLGGSLALSRLFVSGKFFLEDLIHALSGYFPGLPIMDALGQKGAQLLPCLIVRRE